MIQSFAQVPINYDKLKEEVRHGLPDSGRKYWWPHFPTLVKSGRIETLNPNWKESADNKYSWARQTCKDVIEILDATDVDPADELLRLLMEQYRVDEPVLFRTMISVVLGVIPEKSVCFSMFCGVFENPDWFLVPTAKSHRLKLYTFKELARKYYPAVMKKLELIGAISDSYLNLIFVDIFQSIFPRPCVHIILDAFLLEGSKVLFRFGLSLLNSMKTRVLAGEFSSSEQFWSAVKAFGRDFTAVQFLEISKFAYKNPSSFSRSTLYGIESRGCKELGDNLRPPLGLPMPAALMLDLPSEELRRKSTLLTPETASRLRSYLPNAVVMEGLSPVFSTVVDGWSLDTLYRKAENIFPCLLLLTVANDWTEGGGLCATIGVFMSGPISPPGPDVRGDGGCFVFRLDGPNSACYKWNPPRAAGGGPVTTASNEFALCTSDFMLFGGSAQLATNAIRIEADLAHCSSGPSDTYGNTTSLVPEAGSLSFLQLSAVEVLCGKHSSSAVMSSESYLKRSTWAADRRK